MSDPVPGPALLHRLSPDPVAETVVRIRAAADQHGIRVFGVVDHAAAAAAVGLQMPPTQVVLLGSPRAGTPLMLEAPDLALDLPTRVLVRERPPGSEVVLHDPLVLASQHHLGDEQARILVGLTELVRAALRE